MRSVPIHGELTADGTRVVLMAAGMFADDVERVGRQLGLLTPTPKPTEPKGGISFPISWALCVQLAMTFGSAWHPGPRLKAWVLDQVQARTAESAPLTISLPAGKVPRPYQVDGAQLVANSGSCLITDEPGTGKTITTILGLLERASTS
jgi:hypothetical protein